MNAVLFGLGNAREGVEWLNLVVILPLSEGNLDNRRQGSRGLEPIMIVLPLFLCSYNWDRLIYRSQRLPMQR